eukprot:3472649-Lingulodinium_polyedra.AAC.1
MHCTDSRASLGCTAHHAGRKAWMAVFCVHSHSACMACDVHTAATHEEDATLQVPADVEVLEVDDESSCGPALVPGLRRRKHCRTVHAGMHDTPPQSPMLPAGGGCCCRRGERARPSARGEPGGA